MNTKWVAIIILKLSVIVMLISGCGTSQSPISPDLSDQVTARNTHSRSLLGLWQFTIDPENETVSCALLRSCEIHMNALAFMEPPAGAMLAIDQVVDFSPGEITVDIALTHPYGGLNFATAFDVTGILISHGSLSFPFVEAMKFAGEYDVRLLNPDGFTRWWNPEEFPSNPDKPQSGYIDGLLGTPDSIGEFTSTLNGYKYFASDLLDPEADLSVLDVDMRGAFIPGTTCIRRYQIGFTPGSLVFNYAVDASWAPPTVMPPVNIPGDFPSSANRPEAYRIEVHNLSNGFLYDVDAGMLTGQATMSVYVFDWFKAGESKVCCYAQNDELMGMCTPWPSGGDSSYSYYNLDLWPGTMDSGGDVELWFGIECDVYGYGGALPMDLQGVYFRDSIFIPEG